MATKQNRLGALTADLDAPDADAPPPPNAGQASTVETRFPPLHAGAKPKTGPGNLMAFRSHMLDSNAEMDRLRESLKLHEGSLPTKKIDPKSVRQSQWANRHTDSFKSASFAGLKAEIERAGGNVQPILVRPQKDQADQYEVVFGHRRHRACLELGLPVLAMIWQGELPDTQLFITMDRENRERADLSPYEQGQMYARALEERLFPSARQLADSIGVSHTWVYKTLAVAQLPTPIVEAFNSVLEIQPSQAKVIHRALEEDQKAVLKRLEKIRGKKLSAGALTDYLVRGEKAGQGASAKLKIAGRAVGGVVKSADGSLTIKVNAVGANEDLDDITVAIKEVLQSFQDGKAK